MKALCGMQKCSPKQPPLIIVGMHRSGTSVVARCLELMGVFTGRLLDENHEPLFFANLNNWLIRQCGADWDWPMQVEAVQDNSDFVRWSVERLKLFICSPRSWAYLGLKNTIKFGSIPNLQIPWGWKDPRNLITLPIWSKVFPSARVVLVKRHGVDVAESLRVRAQKMIDCKTVSRFDWMKIRPQQATNSIRCLNIQEGLQLWSDYNQIGGRSILTSGLPYICIKFEDLMTEPNKTLRSLATFANLPLTEDTIISISKKLHFERAFGYLAKPSLLAFAEHNSDLLKTGQYKP
jgi:hypothetical protein